MSLSLHARTRRASLLPWETLQQIYSYCDLSTLRTLASLSFGSWQTASPFLYERVELTDLDGLASSSSSARLRDVTRTLTRIRSLTLDIRYWGQAIEPFLDADPGPDDDVLADVDNFWDVIDPIDIVRPHRLHFHTYGAKLLVPDLIILRWPGDTIRRHDFLPSQILPYISPRTVKHSVQQPSFSSSLCVSFRSIAFFESAWDRLERITYDGLILKHQNITSDPTEYYELPFPIIWARLMEGQNRPLEVVFDFAFRDATRYAKTIRSATPGHDTALAKTLRLSEVTQELAKLVVLKVSIKVVAADAHQANGDVAVLPEWLRKIVVVEVV